jgi:hypothetical protein
MTVNTTCPVSVGYSAWPTVAEQMAGFLGDGVGVGVAVGVAVGVGVGVGVTVE